MKNYFYSQNEEYDEKCRFLKFVRNDIFATGGLNSTGFVGKIVYERNGNLRTTKEFFFKVAIDKMLNPDGQIFQFANEVYFYTKIRPFFENLHSMAFLAKFCTCYMEASATDANDMIVFENLASRGFVPSQQKPFLDYDHLVLMMRNIGRFHAYSYKARHEDSGRFYSLVEHSSNVAVSRAVKLLPTMATRWSQVLQGFRNDPRYVVPAATVDKIMADPSSVIECLSGGRNSGTSVLCHCSYSRPNVLFFYHGDKPTHMKILDWQTWVLTSFAVDVLFLLYADADQVTRENHWDELIGEYHGSLRGTFANIPIPSKELVLRELRTAIPFAVYGVVGRLPGPDNEEFGQVPKIRAKIEKSEDRADPLVDIFRDMVERGYL